MGLKVIQQNSQVCRTARQTNFCLMMRRDSLNLLKHLALLQSCRVVFLKIHPFHCHICYEKLKPLYALNYILIISGGLPCPIGLIRIAKYIIFSTHMIPPPIQTESQLGYNSTSPIAHRANCAKELMNTTLSPDAMLCSLILLMNKVPDDYYSLPGHLLEISLQAF